MSSTHLYPGSLRSLVTLLAVVSALVSTHAAAADQPDNQPDKKKAAVGKLVILPGEFTLQGSESFQRLLPGLVRNGRFTGTPTGKLEWSSSNPKVVTISDQTARPAGNGQATITVRHKTLMATAQVTVSHFAKPVAWDFRIHVQSVLTKSGCNGGACHGALAGKNGFKLSLRGYDPIADVRTITRQNRGRRVIPNDPGRSLLLTKPTGAVPHKGGVRFEEGSREYRVVSEWIADESIQGIITTGGTGFSGRDSTPEALGVLFDKHIEGFGELFRQVSVADIGSSTIQSRCLAGLANRTVIFCLPGSNNACATGWDRIIRDQLDARHRPCNFVAQIRR